MIELMMVFALALGVALIARSMPAGRKSGRRADWFERRFDSDREDES